MLKPIWNKVYVAFLTAMAMCNWLNLPNDLGKIRERKNGRHE